MFDVLQSTSTSGAVVQPPVPVALPLTTVQRWLVGSHLGPGNNLSPGDFDNDLIPARQRKV